MLLASSTTTTSTCSIGLPATRSLSVSSDLSTSGLRTVAPSLPCSSAQPTLTSHLSSGPVTVPTSVLVSAPVRCKFGTLRRVPSSVACSVTRLVLVSWDGTSTSYPPALVPAWSTTTTSASLSTRLLNSSPTLARFAVLSGAPTEPSSPLVPTTTWSLFGMLALLLLPSSPRPTTVLRSRQSHGAHGNPTFSQPVVVPMTVRSTSGTPPLVPASTTSPPTLRSPACDGAPTTRRS